jgi:hypothetical protein
MGERECGCGLPIDPPRDARSWRPDRDLDPGLPVRIVAYHGADPGLYRWERVDLSSKWSQHGAAVNFYRELTPPYDWPEIGICWAKTKHAVVEVRRVSGGGWLPVR